MCRFDYYFIIMTSSKPKQDFIMNSIQTQKTLKIETLRNQRVKNILLIILLHTGQINHLYTIFVNQLIYEILV